MPIGLMVAPRAQIRNAESCDYESNKSAWLAKGLNFACPATEKTQ